MQSSGKEVMTCHTEEDSASEVLLPHGHMLVVAGVGFPDAGIPACGEELLISHRPHMGRHQLTRKS